MKKSPVKKTQDKSRSPSKSKITTVPAKTQALNSLYYCHYKNATYMGGIKAFKKQGRGILLHDDGISAITSYTNDLLHGHNIFLDNYGLLSAVFSKNKLTEAVYRTQGFLVSLNYNPQGQLQGESILLNYITKSIIYSTFRRGNMTQKSEQNDIAVLSRVFQLGQLDFLIGITHSKVIRYQFPKVPLIETQKQGNKIIVGFEKIGFINGLGFMFVVRGSQGGLNPDTLRNEDEFQLRLVERGYYINTQLCGMGEKTFKNGNIYVGQFKNNIFEGNGILKNSEKRNWVSGFFENGNLVQLLEYNSQSDDMKYKKVVEALHERRTNWINNQVNLLSFNVFVDQIQKIIKTVPNRQVKSLQQRKQQVLKRIQQKFISDTNNSFQNQLSNDSLNQIKKSDPGSSSIKRFINNFTPNQTSSRKKQQTSRNHNNQNQPMSFQASSPVKRQQQKAKTFTRSSRSPVTSKKQREPRESGDDIQRSPGYISQSSSQVRARPYQLEESRNSPSLRKANTSAHLGVLLSSQRESLHNRDNLDSKRMVSKNKIFRYLQNQNLESSPKFTYTPVDS